MDLIEKLVAGAVAAVCMVFMIRLLLGVKRRAAFDFAARRFVLACRRSAVYVFRWRSIKRDSARQADEAIARARKAGKWKGNVYTPDSFEKPKKPH
jgi:hypothetical protein